MDQSNHPTQPMPKCPNDSTGWVNGQPTCMSGENEISSLARVSTRNQFDSSRVCNVIFIWCISGVNNIYKTAHSICAQYPFHAKSYSIILNIFS